MSGSDAKLPQNRRRDAFFLFPFVLAFVFYVWSILYIGRESVLWFLSQFRRRTSHMLLLPFVEAAVELPQYFCFIRLRASYNISGCSPGNALSMSLEYFPIPSGTDFATHRP